MRIPFFTARREMRRMRDLSLAVLMHSNSHIHEELTAMRVQLGARDPKRELLLIAAMELVDGFDDPQLAYDVAPHLSDGDLAPLVELFHAAGRHEAAEVWERYQAANDDSVPEPDDQEQAEPASV
jgi:hypothetical protein